MKKKMFFSTHEAKYKDLLNRASSKDISLEELRVIITDLVELDNKIRQEPLLIHSKLHFRIKELAFSIIYERRETPEKLPEGYRLSDEKLLTAYKQLRDHPEFAKLNKREAMYRKIMRCIENLEKAVEHNRVLSSIAPPQR